MAQQKRIPLIHAVHRSTPIKKNNILRVLFSFLKTALTAVLKHFHFILECEISIPKSVNSRKKRRMFEVQSQEEAWEKG